MIMEMNEAGAAGAVNEAEAVEQTDRTLLTAAVTEYVDACLKHEKILVPLDLAILELKAGQSDALIAEADRMSLAEAVVGALCARNPDWFKDKKSIALPAATVKSTSSTKLVAKDEERAIELLRETAPLSYEEWDPEKFIRTKESLNLEALEDLTDEQLKLFGIKRVKTENISIAPVRVKADAVKKAKEKAAKKAKAGKGA